MIITLLPIANEVWGKVMSLHLSVSHSVHKGGCYNFTFCYGQYLSVLNIGYVSNETNEDVRMYT